MFISPSALCRIRITGLMILIITTSWIGAANRNLDAQEQESPTTPSEPGTDTEVQSLPSIPPLDGGAWLGQDGIRAAWLSYKQIDDEMIGHLINARVNTVFLKHGFHDLLELETARWDGDSVVVDPREVTMNRMIEKTRRASGRGIHVFWIANYELEQMLPHLKRLGYQPALAEGPSRYLRPGSHLDAAPLDRVFWRGITGAHGELVARLSREHPIDGVLYDTEHYAGGIMYLQNSGFSDATFQSYLTSRELNVSLGDLPGGTRYDFLKNSGHLPDYYHFLEEQAFEQGYALASRWHAINPHLITGIWPLLDNWYSQGFLRGLGGAIPSLGLSGVEYYHGSDQSASMAEFFQSRNGNLIYVPGFYPPYAYSVDQLRQHIGHAIRETGHYWMLGPDQELRQPKYQSALRDAAPSVATMTENDVLTVNLDYRIDQTDQGPMLIVETQEVLLAESPLLSLCGTLGGSPLCNRQPMRRTDTGRYRMVIPLLRRITNNQHLPAGFRSGASYRFDPMPQAFQYEDPYHTKLIDGRAYGFFGTSVAWSKSIDHASVLFDLHRDYQIVRVEVAQPTKLEDRIGGPTELKLKLGHQHDKSDSMHSFKATFAVSGKDYSEPDTPSHDPNDPRHGRAWLSWKVDLPQTTARWLQIDMQRTRPNSSISLGEVVITGLFDGEIQAMIQVGGQALPIGQGRRWDVAPQQLVQVIADDHPPKVSSSSNVQPIDLSLFRDSIHHWQMKDGRGRKDQRYQPEQIVLIAENILKFQNDDGGWPTNLDWLAKIDVAEIKQIRNGSVGDSSFDNRNVYSQIEYLMQVFHQSGKPQFRDSAIRGLNYVLQQQRPSGGWRGKDVEAITFNDDVMVGIMRLLLKIRQGEPHFDSLDRELKVALSEALDRAIEVTLQCQIEVEGVKTAWCQQHDHRTLKPIKARTFELPSITAQESVGIVRFLMELPDPASEVIVAVKSAIAWLESAKIEGLRIEIVPITPVRFDSHTASFDRREVFDDLAPPVWARFYELDTNRPFFCNRDGKPVYRLDEVQLERRSGYGWYGYWPTNLLVADYPAWKAKIQ